MLPNNNVLLVTTKKFETNLVLVIVNKLKPYKYMESKVQKQEQSIGGLLVEDFDTDVEDDDCDIQKPHIQTNEDEEQMQDLLINTILIVAIHMTNEFVSNNYKSDGFGKQKSTNYLSWVLVESTKYSPSH